MNVAAFTNRYHLSLARETRLADKQADVYLALSEHTVRLRQYALIANPDVTDDHPLMPPLLTDEDRYGMFAKIEAYGSRRMRDAYDRLLVAAARTRLHLAL
jgi:hypothetical protein